MRIQKRTGYYVTKQQAEHARKLWKGGMRQELIAIRTGISIITVRKILIGEWQPYEPKKRELKLGTRAATHAAPRSIDAKRCPECGALVYLPCKACAIELKRNI